MKESELGNFAHTLTPPNVKNNKTYLTFNLGSKISISKITVKFLNQFSKNTGDNYFPTCLDDEIIPFHFCSFRFGSIYLFNIVIQETRHF